VLDLGAKGEELGVAVVDLMQQQCRHLAGDIVRLLGGSSGIDRAMLLQGARNDAVNDPPEPEIAPHELAGFYEIVH
jgi:hypothetical protein